MKLLFSPAHLGTPWYFLLISLLQSPPSKGMYRVAENLGLKDPSKILCQGTSCRNAEPTHSSPGRRIVEAGADNQIIYPYSLSSVAPWCQWDCGSQCCSTDERWDLWLCIFIYIYTKKPPINPYKKHLFIGWPNPACLVTFENNFFFNWNPAPGFICLRVSLLPPVSHFPFTSPLGTFPGHPSRVWLD